VRPVTVLACLLLGACSAWPSGSYVGPISDADAAVLAPEIADYLATALPAKAIVTIPPAPVDDPIAPILAADLDRSGIKQGAGGTLVQYVADPLDSGVILRISIDDREGASRYFVRTNGMIAAAGPLTVVTP
jgi:type IV secretion system protein TrbH